MSPHQTEVDGGGADVPLVDPAVIHPIGVQTNSAGAAASDDQRNVQSRASGVDGGGVDDSDVVALPRASSQRRAAVAVPTELATSALLARYQPGVDFFATSAAVKQLFMVCMCVISGMHVRVCGTVCVCGGGCVCLVVE